MKSEAWTLRTNGPDLRAHGRLAEADMAHATRDAWRLVIDPLLAKLRA